MKQGWTYLVAVIAALVFAGNASPAGMPKSSSAVNESSGMTWEEVLAEAKTPKDMSFKIRHNVRYEEDLGDEWKSGRETWTRGVGDCEDMAQAVIDFCKAKGFEAEMYAVYPAESAQGHAIAMGRYKGRLWMSSNGWFQYVDSKEEAAEEVAREMRWRNVAIVIQTVAEMEASVKVASDW